jgi:RNA-directed DNA polymerase
MPEAWSWVKTSVWTPRMVQALSNGVEGGRWYSLVDKIISPRNLKSAFARVKANKGRAGVDHVSVEAFARDVDRELTVLHESLRTGSYRPSAILRRHIPKPDSKETRPLGIPTVRDRVVQAAVLAGIEPIFESQFSKHSYGFRPMRSAKAALTRVDKLLRTNDVWVVDVDLKSYFDTVPHEPLMRRVRERVSDGKVLELIESFLKAPVQDADKHWIPAVGTPQGGVVSPLLANLYLDPLDHLMAGAGYEMTRYADDFVIQCDNEASARRALEMVETWSTEAGLSLHPTKTRIVRVTKDEGFDFLGFHFRLWGKRPGHTVKWPRAKSQKKVKDAIREHTRRTAGTSLAVIILRLNRILRGFFEYFRASISDPFVKLDKWIRMRLRCILRRRQRRRPGRRRGRDHQRWPNAFFKKQGLYSLARAQAEYWHPPRG